MGHALKLIQFDPDENEKLGQNNINTGTGLKYLTPSLLTALKYAAILSSILGVASLVIEVKYYFQFSFEIYIARLIPTLFSFLTLLFIQSKIGKKHKVLLTHIYLITILGSISYVMSKTPSLFLYNGIAAALFVLTLSLFFVWEVKNQILVSGYLLIFFGAAAYFANLLDFNQAGTWVASITFVSVMIISVLANYLLHNTSSGSTIRHKSRLNNRDDTQEASGNKSLIEFFSNSTIPFFQISTEGKIKYSNLSFNEILGVKNSSDFSELNFFNDFVNNENVKNHILKKLENKGRLENYRLNITNKEGKKVVLFIDCKIGVDEENNEYLEGSIRDITKQYEKEQAILKELETLRKKKFNIVENVPAGKISGKKNLISSMGHELRTPMNSVLGFLTLIENGLFESEEELKDFSHSAKLSAESLLNLMNDIVEISKIEDGTISIESYEFNLREEINKVTTVVTPHVKEKNINLVCDISANIPDTVISDPSKYSQILTNLLNNAVKISESGEIKIFISEEVDKKGKVQLVTSVENTGIGIPQENINEIFNGTFQSQENDSKISNSILHLMICRELTSLLSGTIYSEVEQEKLTKFVFKIPVRYALNEKEDNLKTGLDSSESKKSFNVERPTLLLVEDNPISRKVERKLLEEAGYNVDCVDNGFDAIEKIKDGKYNLVLMDIELKEMNGLETTKKIRKLTGEISNIPIVAVTAHSSMKDREKCLLAGMNDYISKPININFLKMTIDQWLNEAKIN